MIERDVIEGYVSFEKAREEYRVAIDPKTMKVDQVATGKLRNESGKT
jgi:5-oxoprolinase (ATP-hydrolysing)/N-methylhydantoinase B